MPKKPSNTCDICGKVAVWSHTYEGDDTAAYCRLHKPIQPHAPRKPGRKVKKLLEEEEVELVASLLEEGQMTKKMIYNYLQFDKRMSYSLFTIRLNEVTV